MGPLKTPLFHSKYHYQKVVVHRMQASNGETFHVLYLTTGDWLSQNSPPRLFFFFFLLCKIRFYMVAHAFNVSLLKRQRQVDLYEFKVSLVYRVSSRPTSGTW
jgi:hypothetical protein